ncbi:MAG: T9SS type A sorting domain-containing protein, partial [Flavobacteriales bacterium]|nr:T9SS type A sorting domain-containing protein [Flavobacteriales bacterium]
QDEYAYNSYSAEELRDILTDVSGYDLTSFFDDQIFKPGFAVFVIDSVQTSAGGGTFDHTLYIHQLLRECPSYYTNVPVDVSFMDQNWEMHHEEVMLSGEYSVVTVQTDFEPVMTYLNGQNRLNQSRLDHNKALYPDDNINQNLDHVDFRLIQHNLADSGIVRVEHIWAGPEASNFGPGIFEINSRHYWRIDGVLPEGYELEGRISYRGVDEYDLDYELVSETEEDLIFIYREDPSQPWTVYPHQTLVAGNINTGTGSLKLDILYLGEYALANGDVNAAVSEIHGENNAVLAVYPSPARTYVNLQATFESYTGAISIELYDTLGKRAIRQMGTALNGEFFHRLDIADLPRGMYVVRLLNDRGEVLDTTTLSAIM